MFVTPRYTAWWKEIGLKLGLTDNSLQVLESGNPTNPELCCDKMLQKWLEVSNDASWNQLESVISSLEGIAASAGTLL